MQAFSLTVMLWCRRMCLEIKRTVYLLCHAIGSQPKVAVRSEEGQDEWQGLLCYGHSGLQANGREAMKPYKGAKQIVIILGQYLPGPNSNWQDRNENQKIVFPSPLAMLLGFHAKYKDNKLRTSPVFLCQEGREGVVLMVSHRLPCQRHVCWWHLSLK